MKSNRYKHKKRKRTARAGRVIRPRPEDGIFGDDRNYQITVPRRYRIVPPSMITTLVFQSTSHSPLNNAGLTYASVRFRPTSAYDVDPTIGGTSMPGFNEMAGLYGKYRVLRFKTSVVFVNAEDFPLNAIVFPSNFDLGANYSQVQSQFGNSFAKYRYLSPKGGMDRATIVTPWLSARQIVGTDSVYLDDDYSANTNTSPTNNSYINVAIWTGNTTQLTVGVGLQIVITCEVRFSETLHNITLPDSPELHPELVSGTDEVDNLAEQLKVVLSARSQVSK